MGPITKSFAILVSTCATLYLTSVPAFADCVAHSHAVSVVDQGNVVKTTCRCDQGYLARAGQCVIADAAQCGAVMQQAEMSRKQLETLRRTNDLSQEELAEWTALNDKAQRDAIIAGVSFVLGHYTARIDSVRDSVSKLERQAAYLAKKSVQSSKYKTRLRFAAQLEATMAELQPKQAGLILQEVAKAGLEAKEAWGVARDEMHAEFRVARHQNEAIRETLKDPEFKEAFVGGDIETPKLDLLAELTKVAAEESRKSALDLERYEEMTGPAIRAAVFVRDASYNALLSALSTERVLQQNDVAGDLAKATAALQKQYKKVVDDLAICRKAGLAK